MQRGDADGIWYVAFTVLPQISLPWHQNGVSIVCEDLLKVFFVVLRFFKFRYMVIHGDFVEFMGCLINNEMCVREQESIR
jgi:hypothetical protein